MSEGTHAYDAAPGLQRCVPRIWVGPTAEVGAPPLVMGHADSVFGPVPGPEPGMSFGPFTPAPPAPLTKLQQERVDEVMRAYYNRDADELKRLAERLARGQLG